MDGHIGAIALQRSNEWHSISMKQLSDSSIGMGMLAFQLPIAFQSVVVQSHHLCCMFKQLFYLALQLRTTDALWFCCCKRHDR